MQEMKQHVPAVPIDAQEEIRAPNPVKEDVGYGIFSIKKLQIKKGKQVLPSPLRRNLEDILIIRWWKENEKDYKILSNLAKKYLCIPATSVPAERLLSKAGEFISIRRNRLKSKNVDMLLFSNKNT